MERLTRREVYGLIDGERFYQGKVDNDPERCTIDPRPHTVGEFYCMLRAYVDKFPQEWISKPDRHPDILSLFRKIAAISVYAMEVHGAPEREL